MDSKAQASLEYLLLIAAAVLVAAIIVIIMTSSVGSPENSLHRYNEEFNGLYHAET